MAPRRASQPRRPYGSGEMPARSIRVSDPVWDQAKRRANYEGITMSSVGALLFEGYGKGLIDLPKVQVSYSPTRDPEPAPEQAAEPKS